MPVLVMCGEIGPVPAVVDAVRAADGEDNMRETLTSHHPVFPPHIPSALVWRTSTPVYSPISLSPCAQCETSSATGLNPSAPSHVKYAAQVFFDDYSLLLFRFASEGMLDTFSANPFSFLFS